MSTLTNFSPDELRVLGVMIEKALTTPDQYPMTINALTAGCNQKQNRDPVMELPESVVSRAVRQLELRGVVDQAPPSPGARSVRFRHRTTDVFHWDRREMAIMAELMLRGAQTAGELRTRASRMTPFQDVQSVVNILEGLAGGDPPAVLMMPKEPGRSANRYRHLLAAPVAHPVSGGAETIEPPGGIQAAAPAPGDREGATPAGAEIGDLAALLTRMTQLEERVSALENELRRRDDVRPS